MLVIVAICIAQFSTAQGFLGRVIDAETNEGIPFASVLVTGFQIGIISDSLGNFSFEASLPEEISIKVSAELYESKILTASSKEHITISLYESHLEVDEIILIMPVGVMEKENTVRVDRLELKDLNTIPASSLSDAIANLNGVQQASIGTGITKPVIRGMQGVRVLTTLNGMRIENQQWGADHGMGISQLGIGAVEVIKGPSSLLYGADAFGGVIYLADEKFSKQNSYSIDVKSKFESVNLGTTNSAMFKLAKKNVRFNLGALYSNFADFKMPNGTYLADSRYQDMGVKARLGINKNKWAMQVNYMFSHSYLGIPGHTHDSVPDPSSFMLDFQNRQRNIPAQNVNNHLLHIKNNFFLGANKVMFMVGYTHNNLLEYEEKFTVPGLGMLLQNGLYHARYQRRFNSWYLSAGLQGMYQVNSNDSRAEEELIPNFSQLDNGGYAIMNYRGKSNFSAQFGGRYDLRILNSVDFSANYGSPNFSVGGRYYWGSNTKHTVRLNVSTGFRSPHVSELLVDGVHHGALRYEQGNENLKSERATQIDFNYEFEKEHVSLVINPFYNYIQNFTQIVAQDSMIDGAPLYFYNQIEKAQLYGVDAGVHYHPHFAHWLHLEGTFSIIYGESLQGKAMSLIPQPRLNNLVRLKFKRRSKFNLEEVVFQHMHFFDQDRITSYELSSQGYDVVHAGLNFKWYLSNPIDISLGVKNAFNAQYTNHLSRLKNIGVYEPARNLYISLKYQINGSLRKKANI